MYNKKWGDLYDGGISEGSMGSYSTAHHSSNNINDRSTY